MRVHGYAYQQALVYVCQTLIETLEKPAWQQDAKPEGWVMASQSPSPSFGRNIGKDSS